MIIMLFILILKYFLLESVKDVFCILKIGFVYQDAGLLQTKCPWNVPNMRKCVYNKIVMSRI